MFIFFWVVHTDMSRKNEFYINVYMHKAKDRPFQTFKYGLSCSTPYFSGNHWGIENLEQAVSIASRFLNNLQSLGEGDSNQTGKLLVDSCSIFSSVRGIYPSKLIRKRNSFKRLKRQELKKFKADLNKIVFYESPVNYWGK
jgi:hypothetical protein